MNDFSFHTKYFEDGQKNLKTNCPDAIEVESKSPSNIALVKYWGKHRNQFPGNPSVSFTLTKSTTTARISFKSSQNGKFSLEYFFNNIQNKDFEERLNIYFDNILQYFPFLKGLQLQIHSQNTFPHSAGIASSASAFSALAMCVCAMEKKLFATNETNDSLPQKASYMARIGSGSACRSVYKGAVLWGYTPEIPGSSNEVAIEINKYVHPVFASYHDAILVVDPSPKKLSSSQGHKLMDNHAYAAARYVQAVANLKLLLAALSSGDETKFAQIVENEALSLHGLMLSSSPGYILLHPNTLIVLKMLGEFRSGSGLQFAFTLDAGPNVHILYSAQIREKIVGFIESELKQYCENGFWIDDKISAL
jgi:diphosphomevalonate decarboxylase